MKTFKFSLLITAAICMLCYCSKSDDEFINNQLYVGLHQAEVNSVTTTIEFKSEFTVWDKSKNMDNCPNDASKCFMILEGSGTEKNLGVMTAHLKFQCKMKCGEYSNAYGSFKASNGDELFITIPAGCIIRNEECNSGCFQLKFNDEFLFTGGTGQFEGATGKGWTNAYIHNPNDGNPDDVWRTEFYTTGILKMLHRNNLHGVTEFPE